MTVKVGLRDREQRGTEEKEGKTSYRCSGVCLHGWLPETKKLMLIQ